MPIYFGSITDDNYIHRKQYIDWRTKYDELNFFDNDYNLISGICNRCKQDKNSPTEYIVTYYPVEQVVVIDCSGYVDKEGNRTIEPYIESLTGVHRVVKGKTILPQFKPFNTNRKKTKKVTKK